MGKKNHLRSGTKIALLFIIISLTATVFISLSSYSAYKKHISSIEEGLLDYSTSQVVTILDGKFRECKDIVAQVVMDADIIELTKRLSNPGNQRETTAVLRNKLYIKLSEYSYFNHSITGMAFISKTTDNVILSRSNKSIFYQSKTNNKQLQDHLLNYSQKEYLKQIYITDSNMFPNASGNKQLIYFIYPSVDPIVQEIHGVFVVEIDSSYFNSVILSDNHSGILNNRISNHSSITNNNDRILTSLNNEYVGNYFNELSIHEEDFVIKSSPIGNTDLILNIVFLRETFQQFIVKFQQIILLYLGMVSIFLFVIWGIAVKRIYKQSEKIANAINNFRVNQQSTDLDIKKDDKILYVISDQFNRMSNEISKYVNELKEKNKDIELMMNKKRKAEIKAIEAQINPHFIYNALDRINWIAIDNGQYEISELLSSLGSLLRYSINNIDSLVTLRAELNWLDKYLLIQGQRFGMEIETVYSIEEATIDYPIYKMLLQPLVENSVLRGFCNEPANPTITVKASIMADGKLHLQISDNGCGMDREKLKEIREIISKRGEINVKGVGINNVTSRLHLYYGEEAQLSVESTPDIGTTFTIIIPYVNK